MHTNERDSLRRLYQAMRQQYPLLGQRVVVAPSPLNGVVTAVMPSNNGTYYTVQSDDGRITSWHESFIHPLGGTTVRTSEESEETDSNDRFRSVPKQDE